MKINILKNITPIIIPTVVTITALSLTACVYTLPIPIESSTTTKITADNTTLIPVSTPSISLQKNPQATADVRQHLAVSIITASYYCQNNEWPTSIAEVRQYQKKMKIPLSITVNWQKFQAPSSNDQFIIKSRSNDNTASITSTHKPPFCSLKSIKADVAVDIE